LVSPARPPGQMPDLARQMEQRILCDALDRQVAEVAAGFARSANASDIPSPSLLARLRVPLRAGSDKLDRLGDLVKRLRPLAMRRLEHCRVEFSGRRWSLDEWLREVTAHTDGVLAWINMAALVQRFSMGDEEQARQMLQRLATEQDLRARLIDDTLALMARRKCASATGGQDAASN